MQIIKSRPGLSRPGRWRAPVLLVILALAAIVRFTGINWDQGTHVHPDERYMTYLASLLGLPNSTSEYFDSGSSKLNPYNTSWGRSYVYGTVPLFVTRYAAAALETLCAPQAVAAANTVNGLLGQPPASCGPQGLHGYDVIGLIGRAWSAFCDWLCVLLIYLMGSRLFGWRTGLLASALLALAVLPTQLAHFFTVDSTANLFVTLTVGSCVGIIFATRARWTFPRVWLWSLLSGAFCGLAIASKISVWPLAPFIVVCILAALVRHRSNNFITLSVAVIATLLAATATFATFRVAQPYSFIGTSESELLVTLERCASVDGALGRLCALTGRLPGDVRSVIAPSGRWIEQLLLAQNFVNGTIDAPFGIQWANRTPIVFPLINLVFWGLGLPLGVAAVLGACLAGAKAISGRRWWAYLPVVLWVVPYFLYQSTQWTKSMRYLLPIYPFLCLLAAQFMVKFARDLQSGELTTIWSEAKRVVSIGLIPFVVVASGMWVLAFTAIYREPNSRSQASIWLYQNVPDNAVVANEHWDEALPVTPAGFVPPAKTFLPLSSSRDGLMDDYDEDTPQKLDALLSWLNEADYIVLSSNRLYGAMARLPLRFPLMNEYYRLLFNGQLGFDLAADFNPLPRLGLLQWDDQERDQPVLAYAPLTSGTAPGIRVPYPTAEEAFSVYDHARVLIFSKSPNFTKSNARALLDKFDLTRTVVQAPVIAGAAPRGLLLDATSRQQQSEGGTWRDLFPRNAVVNQNQQIATLAWILLIELLSALAWPFIALGVAQRVEPGQIEPRTIGQKQRPPSVHSALLDTGWAVAKVLGLLCVAWMSWLLASTKILSFTSAQIWFVTVVLAVCSVVVTVRFRDRLWSLIKRHFVPLLATEVVFLLGFAFFLFVRSQNPDLWHPYMGGEKPMDFAYLNAVLKSTYFPPFDPWHAGGYINYYYFGWVLFGLPIKALGIDPAIAYNLALPTIYACALTGAFAAGSSLHQAMLAHYRDGTDKSLSSARSQSLLAGLFVALLALVLGNIDQITVLGPAILKLGGSGDGSFSPGSLLAGLGAWLGGAALPIYKLQNYWDATRLDPAVPIAEFPLFTFLYADLHAHMMSMPLVFAALNVAIAFINRARNLLALVIASLIVGALAATNTWDYPTMLALVLAALVLGHPGLSALSRPTEFLSALVASIPYLIGFVLLSRAFFTPYYENFGSAYNSVDLWQGDRTPIVAYLKIYLIFAIPIAALWLDGVLVSLGKVDGHETPWAIFQLVAATLGLLAGFATALLGVQSAVMSIPLIVIALCGVVGPRQAPASRLLWLMAAGAFTLTLAVELVTLRGDIGRMNTLFKFYLQAWMLLSIGAGVAVTLLLTTRRVAADGDQIRGGAFIRPFVTSSMVALLLLAALYPATALPAKMTDRYTDDAPRGLDGAAWMPRTIRLDGPDNAQRQFSLQPDYDAIRWMQDNVDGSPVIMETTTGWNLYRWGNRFSVYTGNPAVIGWNWHQRQQHASIPADLVQRRDDDVTLFYESNNPAEASIILRRYNVKYVISGALERAYHGDEVGSRLNKLESTGMLKLVYQNEGTSIFEVLNSV